MPTNELIFILRILFVAFLFFFLFSVAFFLFLELSRSAKALKLANYVNPRLVVIDSKVKGIRKGDTFVLLPVTLIGRDDSVDLVLPDNFVSSKHAKIFQAEGNWWVQDLNSTNGTMLNGKLINSLAKLNYGDLIQIGNIKLKFEPL